MAFDRLVAEILGMRCERLCDREWTESFNEPRHSTARGLFELALDEELHAVAQADESASRHTPGLVRLLWDTSGLGRLFG